MAYKYLNITGDSEKIIIGRTRSTVSEMSHTSSASREDSSLLRAFNNIESISLANVHATDSVGVDLYVTAVVGERNYLGKDGNWNAQDDTTKVYYFFKGLVIPNKVSLLIPKSDINYDSKNYRLAIKLSASDSAVDMIIQLKNKRT
jgi:hypothetical protein